MILNKLGMSNLWNTCENTSCKWIKGAVDRRLNDIYSQNLLSEIFENSHSTTYRIFKQNFHFEKYLIELPKRERIILCKFRCSNHKLPIVSGRYSNVPRDMRICTLCNMKVMGDEFHYLFQCPFFEKDRKLLLKKYFIKRPSSFKMNQLFNTTSHKSRLNLVKFCHIIMNCFR